MSPTSEPVTKKGRKKDALEEYLKEYGSPCGCADGNNNHLKKKLEAEKCEKDNLLNYEEASHYLKFNPYITTGYRNCASIQDCLRSTVRWTNESLNIWTHFSGWIFFAFITCKTLLLEEYHHAEELIVLLFILAGFQGCMLLSSLYHTFCCTSDLSYRRWLTADLFGVSLSLLAIYLSGIYFAFKCNDSWLTFYISTVLVIFLLATASQFVFTTEEGFQWRLLLFGGWAAYGVVPTCHWALTNGLDDLRVQLLLPQIAVMYILSTLAFVFYISRIPERFIPGKFNFVGSSHQIWHILIFIALYYWVTVARDFFRLEIEHQWQCQSSIPLM